MIKKKISEQVYAHLYVQTFSNWKLDIGAGFSRGFWRKSGALKTMTWYQPQAAQRAAAGEKEACARFLPLPTVLLSSEFWVCLLQLENLTERVGSSSCVLGFGLNSLQCEMSRVKNWRELSNSTAHCSDSVMEVPDTICHSAYQLVINKKRKKPTESMGKFKTKISFVFHYITFIIF